MFRHVSSLIFYAFFNSFSVQVAKCDDRDCCTEPRSSIRALLPKRFLPAPFPVLQTLHGLKIPKPGEHDGKTFASFLLRQSLNIAPQYDHFNEIPYDFYCPSLCSDLKLIVERTCKECGLYFCSKKAVTLHKNSLVHQKLLGTTSWQEEEEKEKEENKEQEREWHDNETNEAEIAPVITIEQSAHIPWIEQI